MPKKYVVRLSDAERAVLDRYCVTCHSDRSKTGGLSLAAADPVHVGTLRFPFAGA